MTIKELKNKIINFEHHLIFDSHDRFTISIPSNDDEQLNIDFFSNKNNITGLSAGRESSELKLYKSTNEMDNRSLQLFLDEIMVNGWHESCYFFKGTNFKTEFVVGSERSVAKNKKLNFFFYLELYHQLLAEMVFVFDSSVKVKEYVIKPTNVNIG